MRNHQRCTSLLVCLLLALIHIVTGVKRACASGSPTQLTSSTVLSAADEQIVSGLPTVAPGLNVRYALVSAPSKRISAVYEYNVQAPRLTATTWVMFAARPPNLPGQEILSARTVPEGAIIDMSPLKRTLLRAIVPVRSQELRRGITFAVHIEANLIARRLVSRENGKSVSTAKELTALERRLALRPTRQFDYSSQSLRGWIADHKLVRAPAEGEVDFARRVFQAIVKGYEYEYLGDNQNRSASHVCRERKSDCGGLCALFVTILRSQGIPARILAGRWATSAKPGERMGQVPYFQEHVKAEFFAQGLGWVPVDLSSALLHDRSAERLTYFGNDPGDFLTMHLDTDVSFDTLYFGTKTMPLLQKASYWAAGSGNFDGVVTQEDWKVSIEPPR